MTTREIFFQSVISTDLPVGILYWAKQHPRQFDGETEINEVSIEQLFLRFDKENYEESINMMMEIEKLPFFMFWMSSPEGKDYINRYCKEFAAEILKGII